MKRSISNTYCEKVLNLSTDENVHSDDRFQALTNSLLEPPMTKTSFFARRRGCTIKDTKWPLLESKSLRTDRRATCNITQDVKFMSVKFK